LYCGREASVSYGTSHAQTLSRLATRAVLGAGTVASDAESKKRSKYSSLSPLCEVTPVAVEMLGMLDDSATDFLYDLGQHIETVTAKPRSFMFLMQHLSIATQRGNAVCVNKTFGDINVA